MLGVMFPPDRMIAHDLSPRCPGGSELCAYMDREWNATPAFLGGGGDGDVRGKDAGRPASLLRRVVRSTRTMVRAALH